MATGSGFNVAAFKTVAFDGAVGVQRPAVLFPSPRRPNTQRIPFRRGTSLRGSWLGPAPATTFAGTTGPVKSFSVVNGIPFNCSVFGANNTVVPPQWRSVDNGAAFNRIGFNTNARYKLAPSLVTLTGVQRPTTRRIPFRRGTSSIGRYALTGAPPGSVIIQSPWYLQSANSNVLSNLNQLSIQFWVRFNTLPDNGNIFTSGSGGLFAGFYYGLPITIEISSTSNSLAPYFYPNVGTPYHIAMVFDSGNGANTTGTAQMKAYVNGSLLASGIPSGVSVSTNNTPITFGNTTGASVSLSDFAIWTNHVLSPTEVLNLRNRTSTPLTVSTAAMYYYSLGANRYGAAPVAGDVGLINHGIGTGGPTFAIEGTGSAVYSPEVLNYTPAVTVADAYVSKSGQLLFMHLARTVTNMATYQNAGAMVQSVMSVQVKNGGSGYTDPTATVSAPTGSGGATAALGTPILRNGSIVGIPVLSGGLNYYSTVPTTITISDPTGTGAVATPTMGAALNPVTAINTLPTIYKNGSVINPAYILTASLTSGGSGYTSPLMSITGGGGTGASVAATFASTSLTGTRVTAGGSGYTSAPAVYLQGYASGPIATATAFVLNGAVTSIYLGNAGSSYGSTPGVVLLGGGGTGATATVSLSGSSIGSITVTNGGTGYTTPPTVLFTSGPYVATATVTSGAVSSIALTGSASGFTLLPNVWIVGAGTGATAVPTIAASALNGVQMTNVGSGYTSTPSITIADPGGTGAAATISLGPVWTPTSLVEPWICIPLPSQASASDVFTYSVPDMWANIASNQSTSVGMAWAGAVTNGFVSNYTGAAEPAFQAGISGELAPGQQPMQVGVNLCNNAGVDYDIYSITANWSHRLRTYSTLDTETQPGRAWQTYLNPTSANFLSVSPSAVTNNIDNTSYPIPAGPGLYFSGGGGSGATATARVLDGEVVTVTLTSSGSGYTSAPTVRIWGPGGASGATATASVSGGIVTGLALTSGGSKYCTGLWTIMWDETDPSQPTNITLVAGSNVTATLVSNTAGTLVGGILVGVSNTYSVVYNAMTAAAGANWCCALGVELYKPSFSTGASVPNTATNLWVFSPYATSFDRTASNPEQGIIDLLTASNGKQAACVRTMDSSTTGGGFSSVVDPSDRQLTSYFSWADDSSPLNSGLPYNRTMTVTSIQPYNLTNTPYVYWSDNILGTTAAAAGSPQPYCFTPPNATYLAPYGGTTGVYGAQFVTEYPHLLKSGQTVSYTGVPSMRVTNGTGSPVTYTPGSNTAFVWVTGPTTFCIIIGCPSITNVSGIPSGLNTLTTAVTGLTNCSVSINIPDYSSTAVETCCAVAGKMVGCDYWITLPTCASTALAQEYAAIALATLPPGQKVIVEYGNEEWSTSTIGQLWLSCLGVLMNGTTNAATALIQRAAELQNIVYEAFEAAGRGSDVKRMISVQFANNSAGNYLSEAKTSTIYQPIGLTGPVEIDYIACAPYLNTPTDAPLVAAIAGVASAVPGTLQYGTPYPWSFQMVNDLLKHALLYSQGWGGNGQNGQTIGVMPSIAQEIASYNSETGYNCQLIGYEGSLQVPIPIGISVTDPALYRKITQDVAHSPGFYDTYMAYYQLLQNSGFALMNIFGLINNYSGTALWDLVQYAGQQAGYGTNNEYWLNTGASQLQNNVSPSMQVWQDWAANANMAPRPSILAVSPVAGAIGESKLLTIAVTFSVPMNPLTINIILTSTIGSSLPGTVSYSTVSQTAFFTPLLPLASGTVYQATVTSALSVLGAGLARPVSWSFRTKAATTARWFPGLRRLSS